MRSLLKASNLTTFIKVFFLNVGPETTGKFWFNSGRFTRLLHLLVLHKFFITQSKTLYRTDTS